MLKTKCCSDYETFLDAKSQKDMNDGFEPVHLPSFLFDFQSRLTEWAIRKGRAALFADCGLGKTPMQLVWADNVVRRTNGSVLILTPLAVSAQTMREGEKFGIEVKRSRDGTPRNGITITNYEQLSKFDYQDFNGVVCDESSILKSFSGARRQEITVFMRKVPYRLLCTATAAPNDHIELGTSSEALGHLGYMDVLNRFFKNEQNNNATRRAYGKASMWRFKGHAEIPFWRWVGSWARAMRKPSDLGFDDSGFILPPLVENQHVVRARTLPDGMLFDLPAIGLPEQRKELRRTITERCEQVASLVDHGSPAMVWCHLNDEGDMLEDMIPNAVQVAGRDSDDAKEEKLLGFADGSFRVLVTKPKIGAWGLNFQHCSNVTFFPSHSFEQYYQAVRRCWRFGQKSQVTVDVVTTEGQNRVLANLQKKQDAADRMFNHLVGHMSDALHIERHNKTLTPEEVPAWL